MLSAALAAADLQDLEVQEREYRIAMGVGEYLKTYEIFTYGRLAPPSRGGA